MGEIRKLIFQNHSNPLNLPGAGTLSVGMHIFGGKIAETIANDPKFLGAVAHNEVEIIHKSDKLPTAAEWAKVICRRDVGQSECPYNVLRAQHEYNQNKSGPAWDALSNYLNLFELAMGKNGGCSFYYRNYCAPVTGEFKSFTVAQIQDMLDQEETGQKNE
jgi:hypothetical protein